ncbi:MAG: imidazoleglycerol-phosphate dehydratase HisB [Hydrogenophilaceae bacterium]|nr:imidazoleglycerol-phosphate dehydratase HisB [Hydrogenophilaceae bacterium]
MSAALRARMAAVYGVAEACVLPVRGPQHGLMLVMRRIALDGFESFAAPMALLGDAAQLMRIERLAHVETPEPGTGAALGDVGDEAPRGRGLLRVIDERWIEYGEAASRAQEAAAGHDLIVLRSLAPYGLTDAPCGAAIASPALIARLEEVMEPEGVPALIARAALGVLEPQRLIAARRRIAETRGERARMVAALRAAGIAAEAEAGPFVCATISEALQRELRALGVAAAEENGRVRIKDGEAQDNDVALAALGAATPRPRRRGRAERETKETRIVVDVDLDREGQSAIETGVGFFDHMLMQIASHGGFSLTLACSGDLEVDAHHTIEDCALALGAALKEALGARAGIARFGFVLPMDEAEAKVSIDLSGRPYCVFDGAFKATHIGEYPTQMTEHVFRSLAQSMGAAIHVAVTGENDHHTTEACYKAFGRALRQAVRIEGAGVPSTKGVIA